MARHPACLLQVSWLGAWALLLGFLDYHKEEHRRRWLPCLRPEEADMLEVVQLWARIASAAGCAQPGVGSDGSVVGA